MSIEEQTGTDPGWRTWAYQQLNQAGWTHEDEATVRYLAEQFLGLAVIQMHRGTAEFEKAIALVVPLLHGRALDEDDWSDAKRSATELSQTAWIRVQPGQELNRQDRVRVRPDAYDDQRALLHNGRTGSIMMVRYGRAVVHYEGDVPGSGHDHDIRLLDKLVVVGR